MFAPSEKLPTGLPSTQLVRGAKLVPNQNILRTVENPAPTTPVSISQPTWLTDVNAKSRVEDNVKAFLDTLDPSLRKLIQEDINTLGGVSEFLCFQSNESSFTEADVAQSVTVAIQTTSAALEFAKEVKINAISPNDFSAVKSSYRTHRESVRPRKSVKPLAESTEKPTKEALIDAILNSSADTPEQKAQLLELIFNDTSFNPPLPKSIQAAAKTARTQKMLQNTCHFRTFLGLFSPNETAKARAQEANAKLVAADDAEKDKKAHAKALLKAILDNDLNAYAIAFHKFKANIQYADVAEGQQSSPSSSIELANRAYQVLMGAGETANLFGEIVETNSNDRSQTLNAVIQLAVPDRDQSLTNLFKKSATTGNELVNSYILNDGSNHVVLSIPRVYITAAGRQKNMYTLDMNWNPIQIDGERFKPVAIGVHYGASSNGGHHECYTPGTPITDAMKRGLEYVVLEKAS